MTVPRLALVVTLVTFLINILIRKDVVLNETLILDDLIYLPSALFGNCIIPPRHPIDFTFICVLFSSSIAAGRTLFIAYLAVVSGLAYYLLKRFHFDNGIAIAFALACFCGIPVVSQGTFISGSYPTHGIAFTLLALLLAAGNIADEDKLGAGLQQLGIALGFFCAGIAATSMTLVSLSLFPLVVQRFLISQSKDESIRWLAVAAGPAVTFTALQLSGIFSNHYRGLSGWIDLSLENILTQIAGHATAIHNTGGLLVSATLILGAAYSAALYLLQLGWAFYSKGRMKRSQSTLALLSGIAWAGLISTVLPTLLVAGSAPRYLTAPLMFLLLLTSISLQSIRNFFNNCGFIVTTTVILAWIVSVTSVSAMTKLHHERYGRLMEDQLAVSNNLRSVGNSWQPNSQVLYILDSEQQNFTGGYNHWSTHFTRFATSRPDVIGLIGHREKLTHNPFVGTYADHGRQFWSSDGDRTYRKEMVGLEYGRPTYIYDNQDSSLNQSNGCIVIVAKGEVTTYRADESGVAVWRSTDIPPPPGTVECTAYWLDDVAIPWHSEPEITEYFDGTRAKIKETGFSDNQGYEIQFAMRPEQVDGQEYAKSDTSPPMPMLAYPLSLYQEGDNRYTVALNCSEQKFKSFRTGAGWSLVRISSNGDGVVVVEANGQQIVKAQECDTPKRIILGQGFKKRYWRGHLGDIKISTLAPGTSTKTEN